MTVRVSSSWVYALAVSLCALCLPLFAAAPEARAAGCENEGLREEQAATHLPDCRAYEQVSARDKGFSNVDAAIEAATKITVAPDGEAVAYCNVGSGGAVITAAAYCGSYLARRTGEGWHTATIAPVACGQGSQQLALTGDLAYAILAQPESASCGVDPLDPAAPLPGGNLYRESLTGASPSFDLLTPRIGETASGVNQPFNASTGKYEGASAAADHLLFTSVGDQCSPAPCGLATGTSRLFEWEAGGGVRLVARDGAGGPLLGASALGGGVSSASGGGLRPMTPRGQGYGAVSADGSRIYFQNEIEATDSSCRTPEGPPLTSPCALYLRENATTTKVSQQECAGGAAACPEDTAPAIFKWANPSGVEAVFETTAKLVDDDPSASASDNIDLYMFRQSANPASDKNLVLLSKDGEPADGGNAGVQGVLGMSEDGDTVFFVAGGQLVAGGSTAAGPKVYRWRWNGGSPALEYLATLNSTQDGFIWLYAGGNNNRTLIERVSPGGERLLVDTTAQLDPVADQDSTRDLYRWSAVGGWQCLSCQAPGVSSAGPSSIAAMSVPPAVPDLQAGLGAGLQDGVTHNSDPIQVASEDGRRVFFTSMDRLAGADVNDAQDVYEWEEGVGVSLISGGQGGAISKLVATSASGDDVFFVTSDRLVGWDTDGLNDVYDARVDGGFPEPPPPLDICASGESCHLGGTQPLGSGAPATPGFNGPADPIPLTRCRKGFDLKTAKSGKTFCKKAKKTKRHKKHNKKSKGKRRGGGKGR